MSAGAGDITWARAQLARRMVILRVRRNLWLLAVGCLLALGLVTFRREGSGVLEGSQGMGSDVEGNDVEGSHSEGNHGQGRRGEGSLAVFGSDPGGGLRILSSREDLATIHPLGCVTTEQIAGGQLTATVRELPLKKMQL